MRIRTAIVLLTSALMIVAPTAGRAQAASSVRSSDMQITGLYNLTLVRVKTGAEQRVDLVLDQGLDAYSGMLQTEQYSVALEEVRYEGETLHAVAPTNAGRAKLTLRISGADVSGTMKIGKRTINVKGVRAAI